MRNKRFMFFICILALLLLGFGTEASAQPTDEQVKKDLTAPKTVLVTLGKPGKVEWSSTYKKYVWTRNFTSKLKTDDPDIFVIVKGYIVYDLVAGKYVKWRTFTTSNSYEGIPDPTPAEVQALVEKFGLAKFMDSWYDRVIGKVESAGLAAEPKFEWHTPNSVSFNFTVVYTERTNDVGGKERLKRTLRIRLYRDGVKMDWKSLLSTNETVEKL